MRFMILFLALFVGLGCQTTPKCGVEVRAAFDVGSGSTKMKVAEVNTCTHELVRVTFEDQIKVDYRDALEKNSEGVFSEAIQQEGLAALGRLKSEAQLKGAQKFTGVATAAFRQAKNAPEMIRLFRETLGIPVRVISQNDEAMFGYQAAVLRANLPGAEVLVWDIGGGSQQMVMMNEKAEPSIYYGQLAAVSFKNYIISQVQKKDPKKVNSPNPIKKSEVKPALGYVEVAAKSGVPGFMIFKTLKDPKVVVLGIGGVLTKSIPGQLKEGEALTLTNIKAALDRRVGMTDKQIGSTYAETDVSNLILVYGFMKTMGIKEYRAVDAGLVDGLWLHEDWW